MELRGATEKQRSLADSPCLLDEHNLILALDPGQRGFDLAPHLLPVLVLVVTVMQVMLRVVAVAVCVVKHDIAIAPKHVLVAQDHLARFVHALLHSRVHVQPGTESNNEKLEQMRQTVDEKLHTTLEKRLTDSFGLVTEQLGRVQLGLGEMKDLANGVGDLKRVLTNVKTRGGFGEVQLGLLLDQMLSPEQYITNARIREDSQESVEYAIRMPGTQDGEPVLLPVDAKFPREAWERLEDAQSRGDQAAMKDAGNKLEGVIRASAKTIKEKYVVPPTTTGFAVMFLPTEGLFAEVVRRPGLVDDLQSTFHVCLAGPTTFAALLTSLQMGFRTLAIQKKGSEVWKLLAATKVEFENFGGLMAKVEKQVGTVQTTLKLVNSKTRTINRRLRAVEVLDTQAALVTGAEREPSATDAEPATVQADT